jgi:hypothetical protein
VYKVTFDEKYYEWKSEGLRDREIADLMNICVSTLKRIKNLYNIGSIRVRENGQGLTQEQLKIADENGITRRLALRRVREYHWTPYHAVNVPKGMRPENYGKTKHQLQLEKSEYFREKYKQSKLKVLRG